MTSPLAAHQIASKAIGATVAVAIVRDPSDGPRFAVSYESGASRWLSKHRFQDVSQADAACVVLADWLGCEVRG